MINGNDQCPINKHRLHQVIHANASQDLYILLNYRYAPNSMQCCAVPKANHYFIVTVVVEQLGLQARRGVRNTVWLGGVRRLMELECNPLMALVIVLPMLKKSLLLDRLRELRWGVAILRAELKVVHRLVVVLVLGAVVGEDNM